MRILHRLTLTLAALTLILATIPPASARAADPTPACKIAASKTQALPSRQLFNRPTEYYGRLEMGTPVGNQKCMFRQLHFTVGRLVDDEHPGKGNGPVVTIVIQHGLFHRRSTAMTIYNINVEVAPTSTVYTVDAEAASPQNGAYYAQISVVGLPQTPATPLPSPN